MAKTDDFRSRLKATNLEKLKQQIDKDDVSIGSSDNEYLRLQDGKTLKIRIFPPHPDGDGEFYLKKKAYWLSVPNREGELKRRTVLDSIVHGGTAMDVVDEYVKMVKKKCAKSKDIIAALSASGRDGVEGTSLMPAYSWICYADILVVDEELRAKLWEFKKQVRDGLNKLAMSEDEDEAIETDPFTDVDEGFPILVKYMKNPNRKKGETWYEVSLQKKPKARPLTDEEVEYFAGLTPLHEIIPAYTLKDFETALEGLQNWDEEQEAGLFEDDEWLEKIEEIRAQYDEDDDEEEKPAKGKTSKKQVKPVGKTKSKQASDEEDDDDEEEEKTTKKAVKKPFEKASKKKVVEPEEDEEDDDEEETKSKSKGGDKFDKMDRNALKRYISDEELDIVVKKSMDEDDIRELIRAVVDDSEEPEEDEEGDDEEETKPLKKPAKTDGKSKMTLDDIRKKLGKK
jgi:hypothetical protein